MQAKYPIRFLLRNRHPNLLWIVIQNPVFHIRAYLVVFLTLRVTNPCRKNDKNPNNVTKTLNSVLKEGLRNVGMPYKM